MTHHLLTSRSTTTPTSSSRARTPSTSTSGCAPSAASACGSFRAEDYWAAPHQTLASVFSFLGLAPLPGARLREIAARPTTYLPGSNATFARDRRIVNRVRSVPAAPTSGGHTLTRVPEPMADEAVVLLRSFYAPFNAELAAMLGDERFLWKDV